jgi:hypothetical protein
MIGNKFKVVLLIVGFLFISGELVAKRLPPKEVEPFEFQGVRIIAPHWGLQEGRDQNGGYIQVLDLKTNELLWDLQVYQVIYDPNVEKDVQDVFIESLAASGNSFVVVDEKGGHYFVDLEKKKVGKIYPGNGIYKFTKKPWWKFWE